MGSETANDETPAIRRVISQKLACWADTRLPHWDHVTAKLQNEDFFGTGLQADVCFLREDASASAGELKLVSVEKMSGVVESLRVPPPYTVAEIKQQIELKHGTPTFLQRIISGTAELADDMVPGDVVMLNQEPPRVSTAEFAYKVCTCKSLHEWRSMTGPLGTLGSVLYRWYSFSNRGEWPDTSEQLLAWLASRDMRNVPLTKENLMEVFDQWLSRNGSAGKSPESFLVHVDRLVQLMEACCYSPGLLVSKEPFQTELFTFQVFFFAGRLRSEPATLVVQSHILLRPD